MILLAYRTIRLDLLHRAWISFIDLSDLDLPEGASLFDQEQADALNEAVASFLDHLSDYNDDEDEVRRAMAWVLNLPPDRFADVISAVGIPFPRFDTTEIHRLLELLWAHAWGDWRVRGFDPDANEVEY